MVGKRSPAVAVILATLAAGSAQAATPELSISQRLEDRREVAAGTRAQVLGFEDGRFYANGWHITGEMGGIVTPPLKLLDSLYFAVNDQWVGPATRVHERLGLRALRPAGHRRRRPPANRLRPRRPARRAARARADEPEEEPQARERDGRRPFGAHDAVSVGLLRHDPERQRERPRQRLLRRRHAGVPRHRAVHGRDDRPLLHGDRRLQPHAGRTATPGPATTARSVPAAAAPPIRRRRRCRSSATTARSATARAAGCTTTSTSRATVRRRSGSPSPAPTTPSPKPAASSRRWSPGRSRRSPQTGQARGARKLVEARAAGQRAAGAVDRLGQAEPRRPHAGGDDLESAGPTRANCGSPRDSCRASSGSAPASPTTRGCSRSTASTPRTRT